MTDKTLDLDAIEARVNAAKPGPWHYLHGYGFDWHPSGDGPSTPNVVFACRAREDVPALVAEVRRLQDELAEKERRLALAVDMMRTAHAAAAHAIDRRRNPGGQQAGSDRWAGVSFGALTEFERDVRHAIELLESKV